MGDNTGEKGRWAGLLDDDDDDDVGVETTAADEEGVQKSGDAGTNPYWDEPEPHPDPSRGCIRRNLCCKASPGWFAPGEVEAAAAKLEMEPDEFVRDHLVVDGINVEGHGWVEVFAPVKLDRFGQPALAPLSRVDDLYRMLKGTCIFFGDDGCRIHGAHPYECRHYVCTNKDEDNPKHEDIARMWLESAK